MTYASTSRAVAGLPRPDLWALGTYTVEGRTVDLPVSWRDVERDTRWAARLLREHGVGPGDHVLVTSGGWEAPWFWPVAQAAIDLGAVYSATEVWGFDARRCAMFLRRLDVRLLFGLGLDVAEGLRDAGHLPELLDGVTVVARREAVGLLESEGLEPFATSPLGPALGFEGPDRGGLRVDGREWQLDRDEDGLRVTTVGARAHQVVRQPVGLDGAVGPADVPGRTDLLVRLA